MKRYFLTTIILMVTAITATYAQYNADDNDANGVKAANMNTLDEIQKEGAETNEDAVSVFTRNQFASDVPDATNIRFEKKNDFDEVNYNQKGRKTTAYYDNNSELIGILRDGSIHDLPGDAQSEIENRYPGYTVVSIVRFNANGDNLSGENSHYFVELKGENKAIVLMVGLSGEVSFFTTMK
jgi:hypothetical protein